MKKLISRMFVALFALTMMMSVAAAAHENCGEDDGIAACAVVDSEVFPEEGTEDPGRRG